MNNRTNDTPEHPSAAREPSDLREPSIAAERGRAHPAILRIVFVCVENSNRSQMAEAFARLHARDLAKSRGDVRIEAYSAGSHPSGKINPRAIESMRELGYDLSTHTSKSLDDLPDVAFDAAITMGCGDACPNVRARMREDWNIADPKHMAPEPFRLVRDTIRVEVDELMSRLEARSARE